MISLLSIEFNSKFCSSYFRNNRTTGQKSLRCFPECCEKNGHVTAGFCGRCIEATAVFQTTQSFQEVDWNEFVFVAEIHPSSSKGLTSAPSCHRRAIFDAIRMGGMTAGNFLTGRISSSSFATANTIEATIVFNSQLHSWDYSWRSNRWSGKLETHVVEVAVLKKIGERLESMGSESCPPFQVISSKKQTHSKRPDASHSAAEEAAPSSSSSSTSLAALKGQATRKQPARQQAKRKRTSSFATDSATSVEDSEDGDRNSENEIETDFMLSIPYHVGGAEEGVGLRVGLRAGLRAGLEQSKELSVEEGAHALAMFSQSVAKLVDPGSYVFDMNQMMKKRAVSSLSASDSSPLSFPVPVPVAASAASASIPTSASASASTSAAVDVREVVADLSALHCLPFAMPAKKTPPATLAVTCTHSIFEDYLSRQMREAHCIDSYLLPRFSPTPPLLTLN